MVGIMSTFIGLCTIATVSRMCTRFVVHQQFWWDDCKLDPVRPSRRLIIAIGTMLLTWSGTVTMCAMELLMMTHGAGDNVWSVSKPDFKEFSTVSLVSLKRIDLVMMNVAY
jgi:hypothetical protein